jgi:hypothetical protein
MSISVSAVTITASVVTAVSLGCASLIRRSVCSYSRSPRQGAFSVRKLRFGRLAAFSLFWGSAASACSMAAVSLQTSPAGTVKEGVGDYPAEQECYQTALSRRTRRQGGAVSIATAANLAHHTVTFSKTVPCQPATATPATTGTPPLSRASRAKPTLPLPPLQAWPSLAWCPTAVTWCVQFAVMVCRPLRDVEGLAGWKTTSSG